MDRDEFMDLVYETFADEPDNVLANGIIEAADAYVEHEKAQLSNEDATKDATSELIERQQAIDAIVQCTNRGDEDALREYVLKHNLDNDWTGGILEALDAVEDLPTAQPEPKEGHWIEGGIYRDVIECHCSECGQLMTTAVTVRMNFCPNCGAKMTISIK